MPSLFVADDNTAAPGARARRDARNFEHRLAPFVSMVTPAELQANTYHGSSRRRGDRRPHRFDADLVFSFCFGRNITGRAIRMCYHTLLLLLPVTGTIAAYYYRTRRKPLLEFRLSRNLSTGMFRLIY